MRWRGRRQSSNVEDRRGAGGGFGFPGGSSRGRIGLPMGLPRGRSGGGSIIGLIVLVGIMWMLGVNPLELLTGGSMSPGGSTTSRLDAPAASAEDKELGEFVATVLADTEDTWTTVFAASNETYPKPTLVLFSDSTRSACGFASAATGPFYCPGDRKIYIDLAFYQELRRRFSAPGDFAQAYVLAHEVGHHIQNLTGVLPRYAEARQRLSEVEANQLSTRVELQADCYAGVWAHDAEAKGFLEAGDIDEALNAASQIGDDAIQKRTQGYVVPESFNHGTSDQRSRWFHRGYETGDISACNTFDAASL